jgi:hypothetical protein
MTRKLYMQDYNTKNKPSDSWQQEGSPHTHIQMWDDNNMITTTE